MVKEEGEGMRFDFNPEKTNSSNYTMSITMPFVYWLKLRKQFHAITDNVDPVPAQWFIDKVNALIKDAEEYENA